MQLLVRIISSNFQYNQLKATEDRSVEVWAPRIPAPPWLPWQHKASNGTSLDLSLLVDDGYINCLR